MRPKAGRRVDSCGTASGSSFISRDLLVKKLCITLACIRMETGLPHGDSGLRVFREGLPEEAVAQVLSHEHTDAQVDAQNVGVIPVAVRMEGIAKSVAAPCLPSIVLLKSSLHA